MTILALFSLLMIASVFGVLSMLFAETSFDHEAIAQMSGTDVSLTEWMAEDI